MDYSPGQPAASVGIGSHWREYLIEAWALGMFMLSAACVSVLLDGPGSPGRILLPDPAIRRALAGLAMGVTAVLLIRSPWGRQSGAHMNPAVTLGFWMLGKVRTVDALGYAVGQFMGGLVGVPLMTNFSSFAQGLGSDVKGMPTCIP